jgi:O-methyltransferase involved in polyketide biosynthesis
MGIAPKRWRSWTNWKLNRNAGTFLLIAGALVYIGLDEKDQAFEWLDKAFEERSEMLPWLKIAAEYDSLRADPRFLKLLRRVGLLRNHGMELQSVS